MAKTIYCVCDTLQGDLRLDDKFANHPAVWIKATTICDMWGRFKLEPADKGEENRKYAEQAISRYEAQWEVCRFMMQEFLDIDCELILLNDGLYGIFNNTNNSWIYVATLK